MAPPRQRQRTSSEPPSAAAAAVGGIIGATPGAAASSAALVGGAKGARSIVRSTVRAILAMLAAIAARRRALIRRQVSVAFPLSDLDVALADEDRREVVFRKRVEQRTRAGMTIATKAKDPSVRAAAIQALLKREQRYAEQRSRAAGERVLATAERQDLRARSPQGAFWSLGPRREHTPDCIAMAGKFWPWSVLEEVHPLLHVGCGCYLVSLGEAISSGRMRPGDIPSDRDALRLAAPVIRHVREEAEEARKRYAHLEESATEELLAREALVARVPALADQLAAEPLASDILPPSYLLAEAAEHADGVMVALYPDPRRAKKLAVSGGEAPDELHVTLAYLGKTDEVDKAKARKAVAGWAKSAPPQHGTLSGIGHFDIGKKKVTYRSLDLPKLPTPRETLVAALDRAGTPASKEHGFTPHMTVDYKLRRLPVAKEPISFSRVAFVYGEDREDFDLGGKPG